MGRRSLLARERDDGRYDLWYVHRSGRDADRLANELGIRRRSGALVGDGSIAERVSAAVTLPSALRSHLAPLEHDAFVVRPRCGDRRTYLVVPLWIPGTDPPDPPRCSLVEVSPADRERVDGWRRGFREALAALAERESISEEEAVPVLVDALRSRDERDVFVVPDDLP